MSKSITFTPAEVEVIIAIFNPIDIGNINTKKLCEDLGVESKGTASSRLSRLRAKIGNRPKGPRNSPPAFGGSPAGTPAAAAGSNGKGTGKGKGKKGAATPTKKRKIKDEEEDESVEEERIWEDEEVTRKMPGRAGRRESAKVEVYEDMADESEDCI